MKRVKLTLGKGFKVLTGNRHSQAARMVLEAGESEGGKDNHHRGADQWLYVLSGRGTASVNGKRLALRPGTLLLIERGENHEIRNTGKTRLETVNFYVPPAYRSDGRTLPPGQP
jgi:mannose-6-phosphate isomerase-like protein (cupin superfamily)